MAIESVSRAATYQTSSVSQPKQVEAVSTAHPVETQPQTIQNVKTSRDMGNENNSKKDDQASIEKDNLIGICVPSYLFSSTISPANSHAF